MLEPDQWDSVLGSVKGTIVRGTERVSSNRLLAVLKVGPDPGTRQRIGKSVMPDWEKRKTKLERQLA